MQEEKLRIPQCSTGILVRPSRQDLHFRVSHKPQGSEISLRIWLMIPCGSMGSRGAAPRNHLVITLRPPPTLKSNPERWVTSRLALGPFITVFCTTQVCVEPTTYQSMSAHSTAGNWAGLALICCCYFITECIISIYGMKLKSEGCKKRDVSCAQEEDIFWLVWSFVCAVFCFDTKLV